MSFLHLQVPESPWSVLDFWKDNCKDNSCLGKVHLSCMVLMFLQLCLEASVSSYYLPCPFTCTNLGPNHLPSSAIIFLSSQWHPGSRSSISQLWLSLAFLSPVTELCLLKPTVKNWLQGRSWRWSSEKKFSPSSSRCNQKPTSSIIALKSTQSWVNSGHLLQTIYRS